MKNNRIDIYGFVSTLIEATEKGLCQWVDQKDASFLLYLENGSISLRSIYDTMTDYTHYDIKLNDAEEGFLYPVRGGTGQHTIGGLQLDAPGFSGYDTHISFLLGMKMLINSSGSILGQNPLQFRQCCLADGSQGLKLL